MAVRIGNRMNARAFRDHGHEWRFKVLKFKVLARATTDGHRIHRHPYVLTFA